MTAAQGFFAVSRSLNRRRFLAMSIGGAGACLRIGGCGESNSRSGSVKLGILHSLSGALAISEASARDAAMLAIEEINSGQGVLGCRVEAVVEDAASNIPRFADRARKLLTEDKVCSIFGCWTSASRKAVLPVLERYNGLLWYPVQYEGNECSANVIYTGSTPNQQILPALDWLLSAGKRRFYLAGSDYIYPRTANRIVRRYLREAGNAQVAGEQYFPVEHRDFRQLPKAVRDAKADVIFSTINGESNRSFYKSLHEAGIPPSDLPVMAMSVAEAEVRNIGRARTQGHMAARAYFQSVDNQANRTFVERFKARYGDRRVTDDSIEAAYFQVHLWAKAVEKANSLKSQTIREAAAGWRFTAPEGDVHIDPDNHHTWKTVRIGVSGEDGQFTILYSSPQLVRPDPWRLSDAASPHSGC